jgi:hypothetical protein
MRRFKLFATEVESRTDRAVICAGGSMELERLVEFAVMPQGSNGEVQ